VVRLQENFQIAYRTWRAEFALDETTRTLTVLKISSGYSTAELESAVDRYRDKNLHREFNSQIWS